MQRAGYIYSVLVEIDPQKGRDYETWLHDKHVHEVTSFDGILWAQKVALDEPAEDGWKRFLVLYGMVSKETLSAYQASDLFKSFAADWEKFRGLFRLQRFHGPVDLQINIK